MLQANSLQTKSFWPLLFLIFFADGADGAEDAADAKYMRRERREGQVKTLPTKLATTTQHGVVGDQLAQVKDAGEDQATAEFSVLRGEARAQFEKEEEELQDLTNRREVLMLGQFVPHSVTGKSIRDLPEGKTLDEVAAELNSASLLDQGYSAEEKAKKMARVELSYRHYQQTAAELDRWLENFHKKEDLHDEHGFVVDRMGSEARMKHFREAIAKSREDQLRAEEKGLIGKSRRLREHALLEEARKKDAGKEESRKTNPLFASSSSGGLVQIEEQLIKRHAGSGEETTSQKIASQKTTEDQLREDGFVQNKYTAASGDHAYVSGFFARDRPNEERLDPLNMKIYKFHDYRLAHSNKHSFDAEMMWKKLPIAPKKVYKQKLVDAVRPDKDGFALVDQNGKELVYRKDHKGFYHQGNEEFTSDDVLKSSQPLVWLQTHQREKWHAKNDRFMTYPSFRSLIHRLIQTVNNKSVDQYERENTVHELEGIMDDHRIGMHMNYKKHGKAQMSIEGMEGFLCGVDAEISKVTVGKLKERIENKTGIPAEAQKLIMGLEELQDEDLLNKRVPPIGLTINLVRKGWKESRDGLKKRKQRDYERRKKHNEYKSKVGADESPEKKQSANPSNTAANQTRIVERLDDLRALRTLRLHRKPDPEGGDGAGFLYKKGHHRRHKSHHHRDIKGSVRKEIQMAFREKKLKRRRQQKKAMLLEMQEMGKRNNAMLLETEAMDMKASASANASADKKRSRGRLSAFRRQAMNTPHVPQGRDPYLYELFHDPAKYRKLTMKREKMLHDQFAESAALIAESAAVKRNHSKGSLLQVASTVAKTNNSKKALVNKLTHQRTKYHLFREAKKNNKTNYPHHSAQYSHVERVVQFRRGRDGKMHVAKERVATADNPIPLGFSFGKVDDGVSVLERVEENMKKQNTTAEGRSTVQAKSEDAIRPIQMQEKKNVSISLHVDHAQEKQNVSNTHGAAVGGAAVSLL
mmetsp:Transcript_63763/g.120725  ORF Transcript_63763/g.120725 Transcript_63763/m.120725 type:complete len:980 (+) Transcript_63763:102-3041(+)